MDLFFRALVLALAMEGLCLALFPGLSRRAMLEMAARPDQYVRFMGASLLLLAAALAFIAGLWN